MIRTPLTPTFPSTKHVPVGSLRVQSVALAGARSARPPGALFGLRLRDGRHQQLIHARLRVVDVLLDEARIHHVVDPVDGE